jgi:hypothetical protein
MQSAVKGLKDILFYHETPTCHTGALMRETTGNDNYL